MSKFSIELPNRIFLRNVDGKAIYWDTENVPEAVMAKIAEVGAKTVLTNAYNGGGAKASDAERLAALQKKMDSWARGEFNVVERGESAYTGMKEAAIDHYRAQTNASQKQAEDAFRALVVEAFGKDAKATFGNVLDAMAQLRVKDGEFDNAADAREAIEAFYAKLADDAAKAREKSSKKLVAPKLDLSAFKKASK